MSIEDIEHLYKNSLKESSIILVDSSKRDKDVYQSPNSYTIHFNDPFKYVYGVEILDSAVPRTMYIIDSNNDTLYFYTASDGEVLIQIDRRDYTLDDLIAEINDQLLVATKVSDGSAASVARGITLLPLSIPSSDIQSPLLGVSSKSKISS